jgi:L-asparaginase II
LPTPAPLISQAVHVEVTRGAMVESRHNVIAVAVDRAGKPVLAAGDIERPIYPRSAIKPLQALALLESGAADRFGLGDREIALACASHRGEPRHVETVARWLGRIGLDASALECGPQLPSHEPSAAALLASGGQPDAIHNNCSGKHSGFLTLARHLGCPHCGYIGRDHPVQRLVLGVVGEMTGVAPELAPAGLDGCGIPVFGVPLRNLALGLARLADPTGQPDARVQAARRIRRAMAAEPFMVSGSASFVTRMLGLVGERAIVKSGAEGVYVAALPELGLGLAVKAEDGNPRAATVVMARLLTHFGVLGDSDKKAAADLIEAPILNTLGTEIGRVRVATDCPI